MCDYCYIYNVVHPESQIVDYKKKYIVWGNPKNKIIFKKTATSQLVSLLKPFKIISRNYFFNGLLSLGRKEKLVTSSYTTPLQQNMQLEKVQCVV